MLLRWLALKWVLIAPVLFNLFYYTKKPLTSSAAFYLLYRMRKLLFSLVALLALGLSSCTKRCQCTTYYDGYVSVIHENLVLDQEAFNKCSDMDSVVVAQPLTGVVCVKAPL